MLSGILNIDKPRGMTSHDVVAAVRRIVGIRAVGHTGTLDPEASGVLLLCLGEATQFARCFEALEKTYWTVLQLGVCTDTQDATGAVTWQCEVPSFTTAQLQGVLQRFQGPLQQIPPMYSAVKYRGQRLYRLARRGQTVVRPARDICIHQLDLLDYRGTQLSLSVTCSKGTYIRTLGEDIGLALGCGAHVVHLQRCRVGPFVLSAACSLDRLQQHAQAGSLEQVLMPVTQALAFLPSLTLTAQQYDNLRTWRQGALASILGGTRPEHTWYRLCLPPQQTVAIVQRIAPSERWKVYVTS